MNEKQRAKLEEEIKNGLVEIHLLVHKLDDTIDDMAKRFIERQSDEIESWREYLSRQLGIPLK